jgi:hypothetical protein
MYNKRYYAIVLLLFTTFIAPRISPAPIPGASYAVKNFTMGLSDELIFFYTFDGELIRTEKYYIGICEDMIDPTAPKPQPRHYVIRKNEEKHTKSRIIFYDKHGRAFGSYTYDTVWQTISLGKICKNDPTKEMSFDFNESSPGKIGPDFPLDLTVVQKMPDNDDELCLIQ